MLGRERYVSFSEASKLRSSLLAIGREAHSMQPKQAESFSKKLSPIVDTQMERAAMGFDPATGTSASPAAWAAKKAAEKSV